MLKNIPFVWVLIFMLMQASAAMATVYECKADQALKWTRGRLEPYAPYKHAVFNFDDENGALSSAKRQSYPAGFEKLKILHKLDSGNDLVASSVNISFRLRKWDQAVGTSFLYSWGDVVVSGHCNISKEVTSLPFPADDSTLTKKSGE